MFTNGSLSTDYKENSNIYFDYSGVNQSIISSDSFSSVSDCYKQSINILQNIR